MIDFDFRKKQLLVNYEPDPIQEGNDANDLIEVTVIGKGKEAVTYDKGDKLLVRRGYVEPLKSAHFKENEKIIFDEDKVLCRFPK